MNRSKKGFVALIVVVVVAIILGAIWLFASIFSIFFNPNQSKDDQVASIVINYLEKKYGHQSWSVTSTETRTTSTDVMGLSSTQIGFHANAQYSTADDIISFNVWTKGTDPSSTVPESDDFLGRYYLSDAQGVSNFANTGYTIDASFTLTEENVPNNIGYIPNISEIASYGALKQINLYQTDSKSLGGTYAQKAETLKDISIAVVNYYGITGDAAVVVTSQNDGFHNISITSTSVTVKISGNDNPYTFPR